MFLTRFLVGNVLCALAVCIILLVKKIFNKRLSVKYHYLIWFIMPFSMIIALLPGSVFSWLQFVPQVSDSAAADTASKTARATATGQSANWMADFSEAVYRTDYTLFKTIVLVLWLVGIGAGLILLIANQYKIMKIHRGLQAAPSSTNQLFQQCKVQYFPRSKARLFASDFVKSPIGTGIFHPKVLIPENLDLLLKAKEIRYIFLHELVHVRHRDLLFNVLFCILQVVYWFNPLVWLGFRRLRLDREIYCDQRVMELSDESDFLNYGYTLLNFSGSLSGARFQVVNEMSGTKKQLKKRIEMIAGYSGESKRLRVTSAAIVVAMALLAALQIPALSVFALDKDTYVPEETINSKQVDLSSYFGGSEGCFVLYDQKADQFSIYNETLSKTRVAPNSTYKIFSGLNGLEQSVITPESSEKSWNGKQYSIPAWNRDQNLNSAMKNSVNWYFQSTDQKLGAAQIKQFLSKINYGNCALSGDLSTYWLESSLRISPLEQVRLLKNFYNNDFGFQVDNINAVKNSMFLEKNQDAGLYGKTGTGNVNGKVVNGWFVGYVQSGSDVWFFAAYMKGLDNVSGSRAAEVSLEILKDYGLY